MLGLFVDSAPQPRHSSSPSTPQSSAAHPGTKLSAQPFVASHWLGRVAVLYRMRMPRATALRQDPTFPLLASRLRLRHPHTVRLKLRPLHRRGGPPRENGYPLEQPPSLRHFPLGPPSLWCNSLSRFFVFRKMLFSSLQSVGSRSGFFLVLQDGAMLGRHKRPHDCATLGEVRGC